MAAAVCAGLMAGAFSFLPTVEALRGGSDMPVLDSKDAAVSIVTNGNVMDINSAATNNVIKWVDFSISNGNTVDFHDQNYLNYVTGSARSDIYGIMKGTGNIYLVNPNGILIGDGAIVDVGSLHLSTKNLDVGQLTDYNTGLNLLTSATAAGDVINMGRLNADVISVEGKNITFKNVEDVTSGATLGDDGTLAGGTLNNNVTLTANSTGEIHIGSAEGGASGYTTNGTTYNYKLVSTKEDLQNMKNNLAGNYMLAKDIDMSGVDNFTPIGNSTSFTGKFDGLGHTLSNLVINKENGNNIGVFGIVGSGSVIENLKLSGGNIKGRYCVGLVGYNLGTVRRVYNDGVAVEGRTSVGGIVGENQGMVTQVWNKGAVSGTTQVGGIVGLNNGGTVEVAYNAGSVNGIAGRYTIGYIGGIVGQNVNGSVENVYNTGNVSAANGSNIGGIVGSNTASAGKTATVSYAYNTGDVSAENGSNVNGIVGENYATVDYVYDKPNNATVFNGWTIDKDGTNSTAVWRQYGNNLPLLTAFLTRKDNITSTTEYNGSADVGATYTATTYSGTEAQNGYNYIKDVSIVTPKDLTVSFGASPAKIYDGTTEATAGTATLNGIVNSDAVSLANGVTANFADKNVGTGKTVNYSGIALTGDKAKNYNLLNGATATGTGTITAKQLTATFADITKTYDGTTNATAGQGTLTGVVASDTGKVSVSGLAAYDTKNVGTRTVNYTNVALSGAEAANYTIADTATGSGTISKADVKISVDNYSRAYDGTTDASGATLKTVDGAIFAGDTLSGGTLAFTDKNAGTGKTITVADVTVNDGNGGNNYNVTYQEGTGEITRRPLSLTANPVSITQGEAVPASFSGTLTGFAEGEGLAEGDSYAFNLSGTPTAVGKYAITGTLSIGDNDSAESGDYGTNYTFANAATNATAFTIAAKYVPPTPTPSAPSGGNGGNTGNTGGNTGSTTPTNPTTPTEPTPIAPSGNTDSTTPNSGGNTSGTGANTPTPLAAAERVIVAAVTETETIAAAATAGATAEMSHIADNVRPTSLTEQPANSGENAAAAPLAAAVETAANAQGFTLTAGGLLAVSNETNSAPKDAMSVESIGHALSVLQHGSGEKGAATAPNTETKSAAGSIGSLDEAVEATDLAIGTEIAETDRESKAGQENLASDTGTAGGADESAEESDEKKKR